MTSDEIIMRFENLPDLIPNDSNSRHIEFCNFTYSLDAENPWVSDTLNLLPAQLAQTSNELDYCFTVK